MKWLWLLRIFQAAALAAAASTVYLTEMEIQGVVTVGTLHLAAFFLTALVCHGAMAADRPASKHLTEYFLWMSAGGVVGGLLCPLLAPQVFNSVMEYPLMLVAACLLAPPPAGRFAGLWRWSGAAMAVAVATILVVCPMRDEREDVLCSARSFFGVLRVLKDTYQRDGQTFECHTLLHGTTVHGTQSCQPDNALDPWTYFDATGPVGSVFEMLNDRKAISQRRPHRRCGPGNRYGRRLRPAGAVAHLLRDR